MKVSSNNLSGYWRAKYSKAATGTAEKCTNTSAFSMAASTHNGDMTKKTIREQYPHQGPTPTSQDYAFLSSSYNTTTQYIGNWADTAEFQQLLSERQSTGAIGYPPDEPIEELTQEHIEYIRDNFNITESQSGVDRLVGKYKMLNYLVEIGIITPEEALLSQQQTALDSEISYTNAIGQKTIHHDNGVSFSPISDETNYLKALYYMTEQDKTNQRSPDVVSARIKLQDILLGIYGEPNYEENTFLPWATARQNSEPVDYLNKYYPGKTDYNAERAVCLYEADQSYVASERDRYLMGANNFIITPWKP